MKNLLFCIAAIFLASKIAIAVTIEDHRENAPLVQEINGITIIQVGGADFSIVEIPTVVNGFENSSSTDTHTELKSKLPRGELVTRDEAQQLLSAFYEKNAFEKSSVSVRGLKVGTATSWAIWCANPWLFGCLENHGSGGTWVEFEVNGRNRSGGMTGYQRTIWMVRKFTSKPAQDAIKPSASVRPEPFK